MCKTSSVDSEQDLTLTVTSDLPVLHCLKSDQHKPNTNLRFMPQLLLEQPLLKCSLLAKHLWKVCEYSLRSILKKVNRLDIVWDVYLSDSLKCTTREKRGKGIRKKTSLFRHADEVLEGLPSCRPKQNCTLRVTLTRDNMSSKI